MEVSVINVIEEIATNSSGIGLLAIVLAVLLSASVRDSFTSIFKLFLYRDSTIDVDARRESLEQLAQKVAATREELDEILIQGQSEKLRNQIGTFVDSSFSKMVEDKIKDPESLKETVLSGLQGIINERTEEFLRNATVADIEAARQAETELRRREENREKLFNSLSREARNASTLKMVMINLFVVTTILFFAFNVLSPSDFTQTGSAVILGIYLSLGAFMIYIIRTSHYRSLTLLAIQEDDKNFTDLMHFLKRFKSNGDFTEHDVDILRLILQNRSEREHRADHPYEVILKGVSGSNIQFKGGNMSLRKQDRIE